MKRIALIACLISIAGVNPVIAQVTANAHNAVIVNNNQYNSNSNNATASYSSPSYSNTRESVIVRQSVQDVSHSVAVYNAPVTYNHSYSTNTAHGDIAANTGNYHNVGVRSYNPASGLAASTSAGKAALPYKLTHPGKMIKIERYSHPAHKWISYSSSGITRIKSQRHVCDSVHFDHAYNHKRVNRTEYARRMYPRCYMGSMYYSNLFFLNDNTIKTPTQVKYTSLDGYIVYKSDTIAGIITFDEHSIILEEYDDQQEIYGNDFFYKDTLLRGIVVFNGAKEMHLTRFAGDDKKLWRVVHTGKLTVYDDLFSLLSINNVNKTKIKVTYNGQVQKLNSFMAADNKKQLIECVNKVYGLNLKSKDFTWKELLMFIDHLD